MKLTNVNDLNENDIIANSVMTDDFQILLNKGTVLKTEYIEKLKELGVREVYIEDEFAMVQRDFIKMTDAEIEKASVEIHEECIKMVKNILKNHIYDHEEELSKLKQPVNEILVDILNRPQVVNKICEIRERNSDIYEHSLNLCCITMLAALRMNFNQNELMQLGTAALLHDLGLRYITIKYENIELENLSKREQEEYKKHTIYGYSAVSDAKWLTEQEKNMILSHHEDLSGKGYPLRSNRLPVLTQILSVCEIIDEMICGIGHKKKKIWEVLSYLEEVKGILYSADVVETIHSFIAVYPVGTKLLLNDNSVGIVVRQGDRDPRKPVVQIIEKGNKAKKESKEAVTLIHLEKEPEYFIVKVQEY